MIDGVLCFVLAVLGERGLGRVWMGGDDEMGRGEVVGGIS